MKLPFEKPKVVPFQALYHLCVNAIASTRNSAATAYDLLAICVYETQGNAYFEPYSELMAANFKAMTEVVPIEHYDFISYNRVASGPYAGAIPKWRFEPSWYREYGLKLSYVFHSNVAVASMCCSWGIAQQGAPFMLGTPALPQLAGYLKQFQSDPTMQLRVLSYELGNLMSTAGGDKALAFSRYNAGGGDDKVTTYGERVHALSVEFAKTLMHNVPEEVTK
jgi:hypothetical protein